MPRWSMRGWFDPMSLFELLFGLVAVILGLALTRIAASVQKLLHAGRRVRWAPEPVLLTAIVLLLIITVWIGQWFTRGITHITTLLTLLQVLKMLAIYFAAASVLPEGVGSDERIDLLAHYDRTRWLTFGALIVAPLLFFTDTAIEAHRLPETIGDLLSWFLGPFLFLTLILIRWRPYNVVALVFLLLWYGYEAWPIDLSNLSYKGS